MLGSREVSEQWFQQALSDRALLERIRADLGCATAPLSTAAAPAAADQDPCLDCVHRIRDTCDLGIPEFGTSEAADCSAKQRSGAT